MSAARVITLDPPPRRVIGRRLTLTVFEDRFGRARREVVIRVRNLPDKTAKRTAPSKHESPLLKLATSGDEASGTGCLRTNSNTLALDGIEKAVIEPL